MTQQAKVFRDLLKSNRYFATKPRLRLFALLQKYNELTINELIAHLHRHDQATVYRNIKVFESLGIINRLRLGWNSKLELSDIFQHHHHHLSCMRCNKIIILPENPAIEHAIAHLSQQQQFQPLDHQLEIRGICYGCAAIKDKCATT